jgi:tetratricopeptide (TPR) repeat protein
MAAGYPRTAALVQAMVDDADDPIDGNQSFFEVADAYVASMGRGALSQLLQGVLGPPRPPALVHRQIARLAKAGVFHTIITTNYDDLLERALATDGVHVVVQVLDRNESIREVDGAVRLMKIHGSRDSWLEIVLSGASYARFQAQHPFVVGQLDVLLRQQRLLFVGCSMTDPRILDWLARLSDDAARGVHPWRSLMTEPEWSRLRNAKHSSGLTAELVLTRANVRPLIVRDHDATVELLAQAAESRDESSWCFELTLTVESSTVLCQMPGCPSWTLSHPLDSLWSAVARLMDLDDSALQTLPDGQVLPQEEPAAAQIQELAERVGNELASWLGDGVQDQLRPAIARGKNGELPLLRIRVLCAGTDAARAEADRFLALPWELLRIDDRYPIKDGVLEVAREAVEPDLEGLDAPQRPLTVVAIVAAPVDSSPLDYEGECYRIWQALRGEDRLIMTDVGTVDELVETMEAHAPPVLHFTGHGYPGGLLFEDDAAASDPVAIDELIRRLRGAVPKAGRQPRLVYLAACHGATGNVRPLPGFMKPVRDERVTLQEATARIADPLLASQLHQTPTARSTAAALHRAGFPQVLAYLGPIGDSQSTRVEERFYAELREGHLTWEAVRAARGVSIEPHCDRSGNATHVYPLGWAQLALYHRGGRHAVATLNGTDIALWRPREKERKRRRLDSVARQGVERLQFGFVGRRSARAEAIRRWRGGSRCLVVQGLGGLGKTALCTDIAPVFAAELRSKQTPARIIAFQAREARETTQAPILVLWRQLGSMGEGEAWNRTLSRWQERGLTGRALAHGVLELARESGALLVYIDDLETLQLGPGHPRPQAWRDQDVADFWSDISQAATFDGDFGVLASSRYLPLGTASQNELPLAPMREVDSLRMLAWFPELGRLPPADAEWLAKRVDGHPRTLEYLEGIVQKRIDSVSPPGQRLTPKSWRKDILEPVIPRAKEKVTADLILPQLISALDFSEKDHLATCCLLHAPAPWELIQHLATEGASSGSMLVRLGLLSPFDVVTSKALHWGPHPLVIGSRGSLDVKREPDVDLERQRRAAIGTWYASHWVGDNRLDWGYLAVDQFLLAGLAAEAWSVAYLLALVAREAGRYHEARELVEVVIGAGLSGQAKGSALLLRVQMHRLSGLRLSNSESLIKEAAALLGGDDALDCRSELGLVLYEEGDLQSAADVQAEVLTHSTQARGGTDIKTLMAASNLANTLRAKGALSDARSILQNAYDLSQAYHSETATVTLTLRHNLGATLKDEQRWTQAQGHLEAVFAARTRCLGDDHPDTLTTRNQLGGLLFLKGQSLEARQHQQFVVQRRGLTLGPTHHQTISARMSLAETCRDCGDYSAARGHLEAVLSALSSNTYLAATCGRCGDYAHPRKLLAASSEFDTNNLEVTSVREKLAATCLMQQDYSSARPHLEAVLLAWQYERGADHHDTVHVQKALAHVLTKLGDLPGAAAHLQAVIKASNDTAAGTQIVVGGSRPDSQKPARGKRVWKSRSKKRRQ